MAGRKQQPAESSVGEDVIAGLRNAVHYSKGRNPKAVAHRVELPERIDVKLGRRKLGLSQKDFAARFGISTATVRNWEQGRRRPEGAARVLLTIIDREPAAVRRALEA